MGAGTSTLAVQERFLELSKLPDISADDDIWDALLSAGANGTQLSDSEFFAIVSAEDIRWIRDLQPGNFEVLLTKVVERLEGLIRPRAVGTNGTVGPQISNCCRILARAFAIVYEQPKTGIPNWTIRFVWNSDLGHRCIECMRQLLHMPGYTIPLTRAQGTLQLWAPGIGSPGTQISSSRFASTRTEVVQTLLSVLGQPLFSRSEALGLDYWTTTTSSPAVLCSILNYCLNYEPKVWITDPASTLVQLALNLLMISIVHLPKQGTNQFRKFLAKLHNHEDFKLIVTGIKARLQDDADVIWLSLLWECVQANNAFSQSELLVELVEPLLGVLRVGNDDDNRSRLAGFALLSISVANRTCAEAMGPSIFALVWDNHLVLQRPGIELATLVDVLWNVAPLLPVSTTAIDQLEKMVRGLEPRNATVAKALKGIIDVIQSHDPNSATSEDSQSTKWHTINFEWDQKRIQWYLAVLWGIAYQTCGRIWAHTDIRLFRVAESGKPRVTLRRPQGAVDAAGDVALDFVKSTASKILASTRNEPQ